MTNISEKLNDPDAVFSQQEIYAAFEELSDRYGFHRDPNLPPRNSIHETTSMTVDGFEHLGVLIVRPRTIRDSMTTIPSRVDAVLKDNFSPSQNTIYNATAIAMAETLIVSPPGIVETILNSTNIKDLGFFNAFAKQYQDWMESRIQEASEKKSGEAEPENGSGSASSSETEETSSQPTKDGLVSRKPISSASIDKS